jgi:predicted nucleotidyltransferase
VGSERARATIDPAVARFAERLRDDIGAERVLLFGSYARGTAYWDSDYDLIIVADHFKSIPRLERSIGLHDLFYEVGGNAPMDLICLTPEEFERARQRIGLISAVLPESIDLLPSSATAS